MGKKKTQPKLFHNSYKCAYKSNKYIDNNDTVVPQYSKFHGIVDFYLNAIHMVFVEFLPVMLRMCLVLAVTQTQSCKIKCSALLIIQTQQGSIPLARTFFKLMAQQLLVL